MSIFKKIIASFIVWLWLANKDWWNCGKSCSRNEHL